LARFSCPDLLRSQVIAGELRAPAVFPGGHYTYSIRINDQWRIVFRFESGNASDVRVVDYH
jgi:hypothetical protein